MFLLGLLVLFLWASFSALLCEEGLLLWASLPERLGGVWAASGAVFQARSF